ncbi:glucose dehydrogenase [Plantibacter sp. Leaf171]|uniref:PQQ-dependent sugar dehydrogenase n=1 Tax=unclassified Plantibacter TaxID=2624265 RepID=UPI0006FF4243|nr:MULTISPECIES: PQQ-dependent sugar dehydrogenase [unclassified Plantibacter]KQM15900.1 glucose dehydrogenase [Plantibacter sp. Leaf1]KQR59043.1 glucose dehydrogenase [Plantibacter sp. Leaf171]
MASTQTPTRRGLRAPAALTTLFAAALALVACTEAEPRSPGTAALSPSPVPSESASAPADPVGPVAPTGAATTVVGGLEAPWSMVRLPSGSTLVSQRDAGDILELVSGGDVRQLGVVPGVAAGGEGGLLGLAVLTPEPSTEDSTWVYAYLTTASDNRIVRMPLTGEAGSYALGAVDEVLVGIPRAGNHNGGRIAFGPDGMLYATAGDAGDRSLAQDGDSLGGKILRLTPEGQVPADNPFPGSTVYSLGHRNPQGLAWDRDGGLWASEFGQNTWDELNRITPGGNYGWPIAEGIAGADGLIDPVAQWATEDASPSGLAIVDDTIFMASLRGERLYGITDGVHVPAGSTTLVGVVDAVPYLVGEFGRIRDVVAGPPGTIWILTNNTDGRGSPGADDDRIVELPLEPLAPR